MERDFWFYRRRASEEEIAARRAITAAARERHEQLAEQYRSKLEEMERQDALV